ncbi:hypothetical protein L484_004108 [Morus notabilis]|uniref:Uncharacterized protein n=1 Tax=Morus notabilis TaxID=981085 RepID=W9QXA2_9ROSA|nr:hypothetical protein L484_004108 [Morus notabilis]
MRGRTSLTRTPVVPLRDPRTPPKDSQNSYFITITISQRKISIKIPKLLAKIMQKQLHGYKRTNPKKQLFRRKVLSIFTNAFGNKKSPVRGHGLGDSESEMRTKVFGFIQDKSNKTERNTNAFGHCGERVCIADGNFSTGMTVIGKRESSRMLIKVSSKVLLPQRRWRWKRIGPLRKAFGKEGSELKRIKATKGGESLELCKKRILIGRKCKPLNISGTLQYDKDGILIPEELP